MLCSLSQYLMSVRPLLNDPEYERMSELAADFEINLGNRLQRYLKLKALWATNYVSSLSHMLRTVVKISLEKKKKTVDKSCNPTMCHYA